MDAFLKSGKLGQAKQASEKPASQPEKVNILNQLIPRVRPPTGLFYRKSPPQLYATHRKRE